MFERYHPILAFFFLLSLEKSALATHETDHRYTVFGVIRNASGVPQSGIRVMVTDTLSGEGNTVFTDENGRYEVLLHLHNNNLGDEIRIVAGKNSKTTRALFNPDDKQTERKSEVNFDLSSPALPADSRAWSYAAAFLLLAGALVLARRISHQRRPGKI